MADCLAQGRRKVFKDGEALKTKPNHAPKPHHGEDQMVCAPAEQNQSCSGLLQVHRAQAVGKKPASSVFNY